jgi:hypothetical protein
VHTQNRVIEWRLSRSVGSLRASVGIHGILVVIWCFSDFDGLRLALVEAWALRWLLKVFVVSEWAAIAFIFAFASAFSASPSTAFAFGAFALTFSGRRCVAAPRLDVLGQVEVAGKQVAGEVEEIAGENVWVLFFPWGDDWVELGPTLDRVPERLNLGYVGTWVIEAQKGIVLVVVDVLGDVI